MKNLKQLTSKAVLTQQYELIKSNKLLVKMINGINIFLVMLNENREIIYMNDDLCHALNVSINQVIGKRPGEILLCKYERDSEFGCGYSEKCKLCKAKNIVVDVINTHESKEGDVSIISNIMGLEVTSLFHQRVTEIEVESFRFYMAAFVDRSSLTEKENLEQIFYHDILNTASSLHNIIQLVKMDPGNMDDFEMAEIYVNNLIDEIKYQRSISYAEKSKLEVTSELVDVGDLINEVIQILKKDEKFKAIPTVNHIKSNDLRLQSDQIMLRRISLNLLKNAFEANKNHSVVQVDFQDDETQVQIKIKNEEIIPLDYQREIFSKGWSSKGKSRGFGTYGSKLLLNKYLNGNLSFESNKQIGTIFNITLNKG